MLSNELKAMQKINDVLKQFDNDTRQRVLEHCSKMAWAELRAEREATYKQREAEERHKFEMSGMTMPGPELANESMELKGFHQGSVINFKEPFNQR